MNINTESIIIFFLNVFIYQKSSYSNSQICNFFINRNRKQYVNKQHDEQDSNGNKCENTCTFPNGEYNQAMGNVEYLELWDPNQRSLYDW